MPATLRRFRLVHICTLLLALPGAHGGRLEAQLGPSFGGPQVAGNSVLLPTLVQTSRLGTSLAVGDFDGDGDQDLAIGAPDDTVGGAGAGRVDLYLAHAGALPGLSDHFYGSFGLALGQQLVAGDFDGNGVDELAVSAPGATVAAMEDAGKVVVLSWAGTVNGLVEVASLHQGLALVLEDAESFDAFGSDLAVGDFNGDGFEDLAVGVPYEDVGATGTNHGLVNIFYGFTNGLSDFGSQTFSQNSNLMLGQSATGDLFGWSLATGDFDGDGYADLAIGIPGEIAGATADAGGVAVLYGSANTGLAAGSNQLFTEESPGIAGDPASGEDFGWDLAAGDFNGDGRDDLAIGAPGDDPQGLAAAGAVYALDGDVAGLTSTGSEFLYAANLGEPASLPGDRYGSSLVAGSFNGGRFVDLAIGSPYAPASATSHAGRVDFVLGTDFGLASGGGARFQATGLVSSPAQTNDLFGWALAAGRIDGDGVDELIIGIPGRLHAQTNQPAGLVQLLLGSSRILGHNFEAGNSNGWSVVAP
jgi:hypothetical protein